MICCKCYESLPFPNKCPQCKSLIQECEPINRIVRQLLEGISFECQEQSCPEYKKTFLYKSYFDHLRSHGLLIKKPCPKGCGKTIFFSDLKEHLYYDKYDAFMRVYGKNVYEKYEGPETCLNNIVTCKNCKEEIKLTKAIKHECFNNALIASLFGIIKN